MELSKQCTSLEISKRLKELGVRQESYFEWQTGGALNGSTYSEKLLPVKRPSTFGAANQAYSYYPAYTVADLGEIITSHTSSVEITKTHDNFFDVDYWGETLIRLIEQGFIKIN